MVELPSDVLLPSSLQVVVMGAEQNGLPQYYQEKLRAIKTNMYCGPLPVMSELEARRRAREEQSPPGCWSK